MARKPLPTLESLAGAKAPPLPGRANRESVDRERSYSNRERIPSPPKQEQSSHPYRRNNGQRGNREPQAKGTPFDRGVPEPSAPIPQGNPFTAATNILEAIAQRFNAARELQKAGAWKQLQTDLMNASPFICPGLIPYKDLIQIVADIEKEIKGSSSNQAGKSNEELLADFLRGGTDIPITIPANIPEGLDNGSRIGEGDGDSPAA